MIVCDICRKPSRGSKIIVDSQTPNNAPCLRDLQPMNKGMMVVRHNYQIDICPECLQKLLIDNDLPPLYYEEKEKTNG